MSKYAYGAKIIHEGMGGFLCPPGHPAHTYSVQTGRSDNPNGLFCLEAAIKAEYLPPAIRGRASGMLKRWEKEKLPLSDPRVKAWVHEVLGYFANCYKGDGPEPECWHCGNLRIVKGEGQPVNDHAGVHMIREYYPEYVPSTEDFEKAHWGVKR